MKLKIIILSLLIVLTSCADLQQQLPERCEAPVGFSCVDYNMERTFDRVVTTGSINLTIISNNLGDIQYIDNIRVSHAEVRMGVFHLAHQCEAKDEKGNDLIGRESEGLVSLGQQFQINCDLSISDVIESKGQKAPMIVEFNYFKTGGMIERTAKIDMFVTVS